MPVYIPTNGVEAMQLKLTIIKGEGLAAKDRNMVGQRTTSDPYVIVNLKTTMPPVGRSKAKSTTVELGKTKTVMKTIDPEWNESFSSLLPCSVLQDAKAPPTLTLRLFDYDKGTEDDDMGTITIKIPCDPPEDSNTTKWYDVPADSARNAKGKVQIAIKTSIHRSTTLQRGNAFVLPSHKIRIGLSWDLVKGKSVDLDAACVALDTKGNVSMPNSVYYGNLSNPTETIVHSGDSRDGNAEGEDESIKFRLDKVPKEILALYIVLTVASTKKFLSAVQSARVTIVDESKKNQGPMASFQPSRHIDSGDATALFLVRIARDGKKQWKVQPIEDAHPTARDFGSLIPFFKSYTKDLLPKLKVDPAERVSVLRKGGSIQLRDFCTGNALPDMITFGLSWDMKRNPATAEAEKIDLDASVICLDSDLNCVDKVWFKHLKSEDNAIRHGGDQRSGDASGDDERVYVVLSNVADHTQYIGFVVTSYSGQTLDDVSKASCHLFDTATGIDIATHALSDCEFLKGHTALVMGVLYRVNSKKNKKKKEWCLKIIGEAAMGKTVKDNIDELQKFLQHNPLMAPLEHGPEESEIHVEAEMPAEVPMEN